jgi:hypothetical protein
VKLLTEGAKLFPEIQIVKTVLIIILESVVISGIKAINFPNDPNLVFLKVS